MEFGIRQICRGITISAGLSVSLDYLVFKDTYPKGKNRIL